MNKDLITEFSKMLPAQRLDRKAELIKEIETVNRLIDGVDHLIEVYSCIDSIRVAELTATRNSYNKLIIELLDESNALYLGFIKSVA